jgi:hypothetical protein
VGLVVTAFREETASASASCPLGIVRTSAPALAGDDILVLPMHKRMVAQYTTGESGARELHLYYGEKEISFEPELFAFGEALARQPRFVACAATQWGDGYEWSRVQGLLQQLIDEGILRHATDDEALDTSVADRARPSLLPRATATMPRTWFECEAITRELTGRPVELGYLELIVPVFRVAHISLDADGRQVGEGNVFPRALRLEVPTEWMTCIYSGTRHQVDRPMNVSALKSMRMHWPQMMAALLRIRAAFIRRVPAAADGWTVGHVERLATLVLAIPSYQLVRNDRPMGSRELHPALSSLFRVTDGLRMAMHQMMFVPIGEPTLAPDAPMTAELIHDYAERNYSFHSETGVCAGPKNMVLEFLHVLIHGEHADKYGSITFEPEVETALNDVEAALDYGLYGLQAYAAGFSLWPVMSRAYDALGEIAASAAAAGYASFQPFHERIAGHVAALKTGTFLATEAWRVDRERVYADMYEQCGRALSTGAWSPGLPEQMVPAWSASHAAVELKLRAALRAAFGDNRYTDDMLTCLMDFVVQEQAVLRVATAVQARINRLLGRTPPVRPFGSAEADVHNLLQGSESRRLPYLLDEIEDALGIKIAINAHHIEVSAAKHEPPR